jgi:DNA polymerase III alpha subunit
VNHSRARFTLSWEGQQGILWMGLGRVRDLRRASIRATIAERTQQPFVGLRDLMERVPLLQKEANHLIQCGALDGLGESRAALLSEAAEIRQAGSALQMTFGFATRDAPPEQAAQRLAWERHVLGQPVSVHPLEVIADRLPDHAPLDRLSELPGQRLTVAGVRLPGWTGGRGFFLSDGHTFVVARPDPSHSAPDPWQPLLVRGRWLSDEWGSTWLQVEEMEVVSADHE